MVIGPDRYLVNVPTAGYLDRAATMDLTHA